MPDVELHLPPDVAYVGLARLVVMVAARQAGMLDERLEDLKIAVSEATASAMHAQAGDERPLPVVLSFGRVGTDHFAVTISDLGGGFEDAAVGEDGWTEQEPGQWSADSALGVTLIRGLADDVAFHGGAGTLVEMRFAVGAVTSNNGLASPA